MNVADQVLGLRDAYILNFTTLMNTVYWIECAGLLMQKINEESPSAQGLILHFSVCRCASSSLASQRGGSNQQGYPVASGQQVRLESLNAQTVT